MNLACEQILYSQHKSNVQNTFVGYCQNYYHQIEVAKQCGFFFFFDDCCKTLKTVITSLSCVASTPGLFLPVAFIVILS